MPFLFAFFFFLSVLLTVDPYRRLGKNAKSIQCISLLWVDPARVARLVDAIGADPIQMLSLGVGGNYALVLFIPNIA